MANLVGEPLESYVIDQIIARQRLHGSGVGPTQESARTDTQVNLLNSNTSWIKLASGVEVSKGRLKQIGLSETVAESLTGINLAKQYILFGGTSYMGTGIDSEGNIIPKVIQRTGFLPTLPNQPDLKGSYSYSRQGYVPMPGILSMDVKTLNRGSLKKATIRLKVHSREQFEIIDLLYLRLGYTVLLEWGNSMFTSDGKTKEIVRNTLLEKKFFNIGGNSSYRSILGPIENLRIEYQGNYDGMLGKISNFDWSFQPDGSYDITLTVISLGDVVESLKLNIPSDSASTSFLQQTSQYASSTSTTNTDPNSPPETPDVLEDNKDANFINFMLWSWKYSNRNNISTNVGEITINTPLLDNAGIGSFLNTEETLTLTERTYRQEIVITFNDIGKIKFSEQGWTNPPNEVGGNDTFYKSTRGLYRVTYVREKTYSSDQISEGLPYKDINKLRENPNYKIKSTSVTPISSPSSTTVTNPNAGLANRKDAIVINNKTPQYYLRFGYLLQFISQRIVPLIKTGRTGVPMFDIDYDQYGNLMYSLPNQISLDPNVCLVRNSKFYHRPGVIHNAFSQLVPFREDDYITSGENPNVAYPMNIYLNFNFILDCLQSNMDEKGDVGVYGFISSICTGLNKTLGGINNLEPIIDENENILRIIDSSPIPGVNSSPSQTYSLQLYGYDHKRKRGSTEGFNYTSNFIRDINLKTAITPEYATMITIGATGGGYVKGTEATAFSRWNTGLRDRFKEDFVPSNPNSLPKPDGVDEAETNYVEKFLNKTFECYGYAANSGGFIGSDIKSDAISSNISVVTEYYKYLQSKNKLSGGGNIIGFIPFKLGLTMDGLSGIKIYNKINVNTEFMPSNYGESLDLIVTGVSHKLQNNDWETEIEATVIPKTTKSAPLKIDYTAVEQTVEQVTENTAPFGPIPPTNWEIDHEAFARYKRSTQKGKNIDAVINAFKAAGITNPYAMVGLLCTFGKESGFANNRENMNYSYSQLIDPERSPWQTYFSKNEARKKLAYNLTKGTYYGNPGGAETFANFIYGYEGSNPPGKRDKKNSLGNLTWGDGWKYRGGGFHGLTWKALYKEYGEKIGVDLEKFPEKINDTNIAAKAAVLYYKRTISIPKLNKVKSIDEAINLCVRATAGAGAGSTTIQKNLDKAYKQLPGFKIIYK
jgi:predicted chitinase